MGWRFRRSIKIAPGVKININKNSLGYTVGGKLGRYTANTNNQQTLGFSLPGTGLYYTKTSRIQSPRREAVSLHLKVPPCISALIQKFLYFLKLDKTSEDDIYRPEPLFKAAHIYKRPSENLPPLPDDESILRNLYTIIPDVDKHKLPETSTEQIAVKDNNISDEKSKVLCKNASKSFSYQQPVPDFNRDVFLWQCNSVCEARDDDKYQLDMYLNNPEDRLETGYYYAMKDISDENKKERM